MPVERIWLAWPREPDTSRYPEKYAETVRFQGHPYDRSDPLIFHVLSTLGQFSEGEKDLLKIMRDGGSLLPRSMADERWGDEKSMIFARDAAAGDDDYLFMTPGNVFGQHNERAKYNPAVCFRLSTLLRYAPIAFRVHDLESQYQWVERMLAGEPEPPWHDDEEEEPEEEEAEGWYEQVRAESVREQLEAVAELGTQYDPDAAVGLTRLYNDLIGSLRRGKVTSLVPADDPERLELYERSLPLLPDWISEIMAGDEEALMQVEELMVEEVADRLVQDWKELFGEPDKPLSPFPWTLLIQSSFDRPEILVKGQIPLCEAALFRDSQGAWRPVPEEVCRDGLRTIESNVA